MKILSYLLLWLVLASCNPAKKYVESAKKWENEILALEKKDKENTYPDNSILFIGSSSIRLWKNIDNDLAPYAVIQRGVGGAKLSDILVYENRLVNPHKFRAIGVFVANDIHGGKEDRSPEEVLKLYKNLVKSIRKDHKNKPIFFIQITPTESRWHVWNRTLQANNLIKEYSKSSKNLFYIETAPAFLGKDGKPIPEYFLEDKLHLTQKGYDVWADIIKKSLNQNLK
jgi:hypothetical protein